MNKSILAIVMVVSIFTIIPLVNAVPAYNYSGDEYYVRPNIPDFNIPSYDGDRYEDLVPYTLDLSEMAKLAINGLTGPNDPNAGYELWFEAWWFRNPCFMRHEWSSGSQSKFMGPLVLLRLVTGSDLNLSIEKEMIKSWLKMIDDDGFYHRPNRPWVVENVWEEANQGGSEEKELFTDGSPMRTVYARIVEAMIIYYTRDHNSMWKENLENMIEGIVGKDEDFVDMGDWGYFRSEDAKGKVPTGEMLVNDYGWTVQALAQYYRWTGDEEIKDVAKKLINFIRFHAEFFDEDGGFTFDSKFQAYRGAAQTHWHANCLVAFLDYALAANDREVLEWVKKSYDWAMEISSPTLGFIPEMASRSHPNSEGCPISDIVAIAIMLSKSGVVDCWADAERYIRNHFAESQLTPSRGDYLEKFSKKFEETELKYNESSDRVTERNIGAFAGWPTPNEWAYKRGIQHCCTGNCTRAIYYAWQDILNFNDGELKINMLLNRASSWADVYSHIPYVGQVDIKVKKSCKSLLVHKPEWIAKNSKDIKCEINGKPADFTWDNLYLSLGKVNPGDFVSITFPISESIVKEDIAGTEYTITVKGNTVVAIDPPGVNCPLYQREHFRQNHTLWQKVDRFVSNETIRW